MLSQWLVPALALAMCLLISWLASRLSRTTRDDTGAGRGRGVVDDRGRDDPVPDEDVQEVSAAEQRGGEPERHPAA